MVMTTSQKLLLVFTFFVAVLLYFQWESLFELSTDSIKEKAEFVNCEHDKPRFNVGNRTVVGLVFYGRKRQFSILYEYLIRNLKVNGGVLDKIIFAVKTDKKEDLDHLETIMQQQKPYFERVLLINKNFVEFYHILKDDDLVFKIDDDIVFIQNGTFEKMLEEYIKNNALVLMANVINHTMLSHVHARLRAIMPFYRNSNKSWVLDTTASEMNPETQGIEYKLGTKWWTSGPCAAIAHESFLHHIYNNNLDVYDFKRWDFHTVEYQRWSINFILFRGKYVNKMTGGDDEEAISNYISRQHNRHGYALGSAIVAHFSYFPQIGYLTSETDLFGKYEKLVKDYFGMN